MNTDSVLWLFARGSGFAAFLLLTAATVAGLALSMRWVTANWPAVITNDVHRRLTALAIWMTGLHLVALLADSQSGIDVWSAVVPLASTYRPVATALGVVAVYSLATVAVSTRLRKRLGHRMWRRLHGLAFVTYAGALLHGLLAGTDSGAPWATFTYLTSVVLVGGLVAIRLLAPKGLEAPTDAEPARPAHPQGLPPLRTPGRIDPRIR